MNESARSTPRANSLEQRLRNEVGHLTHRNLRLVEQRREMQADLIRQREDMARALAELRAGSIARAMAILDGALADWERKREPRKRRNSPFDKWPLE